MTREKAITTLLGSDSPKNTAEPSIAGVKNGRPAIASTTRDQRATAPAPMSPAMNPSRRIRVNCMTQYRVHPGLAPGVSTHDLVGNTSARPHDFLSTARLPALPARRLVARDGGGGPPSPSPPPWPG